MPIQRLKPAHFFDEERLAVLKDLAPEAFADGKINWSTLKDALGGELEESEEDAEHFGLSWPGKRESRRLAGKPSASLDHLP
jgi:adenine-specific DNA-methyltransferase